MWHLCCCGVVSDCRLCSCCWRTLGFEDVSLCVQCVCMHLCFTEHDLPHSWDGLVFNLSGLLFKIAAQIYNPAEEPLLPCVLVYSSYIHIRCLRFYFCQPSEWTLFLFLIPFALLWLPGKYVFFQAGSSIGMEVSSEKGQQRWKTWAWALCVTAYNIQVVNTESCNPTCVVQGSNSACQTWQQVTLLTEPSNQEN